MIDILLIDDDRYVDVVFDWLIMYVRDDWVVDADDRIRWFCWWWTRWLMIDDDELLMLYSIKYVRDDWIVDDDSYDNRWWWPSRWW